MIRYFQSLLLLGLVAGASAVHAQAVEEPAPPPPAQASPAGDMTQNRPGVDFHAALTPFGTWRTLAPFGEVWVPNDLPPSWRPYTTGHWVFADSVGWTWVDDAPWGWATFHYGRWTLDTNLGWVWIPGDVWAPAWVAWRESDSFVGWAPLPPCAIWRPGVGLFFGVDLAVALGDPWWSFVPIAHLCHPHLIEVLLVPERVKVVLLSSRLVHTVVIENGHPANRAIAVARIEKASGLPVNRVVLRDVDRPEKLRAAPAGPNEVSVFRPHARPHASALALRAAARPSVRVIPDRQPVKPRGPAAAHAAFAAPFRWRDPQGRRVPRFARLARA